MTSRVSSKSSYRGIVYLLESEWEGGKVVKIGRTGPKGDELKRRITQLSSGVPGTLPCIHASLVNDAPTVERNLHTIFQQLRRNSESKREFFEVNPESAVLALKAYQKKDMTRFAPVPFNKDNSSSGSVVRENSRLPRFTFAMFNIPVGKKLKWVDDSAIMCEVANTETEVLYKGKRWALSTLTRDLKRSPYWLQGIKYWMYEGQTLLQRRDEIVRRRQQ